MSIGSFAKPVISFPLKSKVKDGGFSKLRNVDVSATGSKLLGSGTLGSGTAGSRNKGSRHKHGEGIKGLKELNGLKRNMSSAQKLSAEGATDGLVDSVPLIDGEKEERTQRFEEEQEWVRKASQGDVESFKLLYDRYFVRLRSVAFGILLNEEDAADVCQEAFFKAYKSLPQFRSQSSFYTWIYRIVYNLCIDLSRKSSRKREIATSENSVFEIGANRPYSEYFMPPPTSPEEEVYRSELAEGIALALEDLSPAHRAVVTLREIDGLSYDEISKSLDCSVGTVMSRLHHARKKLCASLERIFPDRTPLKRLDKNETGALRLNCRALKNKTVKLLMRRSKKVTKKAIVIEEAKNLVGGE
jgi:RNA polymerase sigma-70 factor (ECF subfamily)